MVFPRRFGLINVIFRYRYILGIAGLLILFAFGLGYYKGQIDKQNSYLKKDIGKGIENNEILSNRGDHSDMLNELFNGKL